MRCIRNTLLHNTTTNTPTITSSAIILNLRRSNKAMDVPGQERQWDPNKAKEGPQRVIVKRRIGQEKKVYLIRLMMLWWWAISNFPVYMYKISCSTAPDLTRGFEKTNKLARMFFCFPHKYKWWNILNSRIFCFHHKYKWWNTFNSVS